MFQYQRRNNKGVLERWINFILFGFAMIVFVLMLLDGIFYILMQSTLDMVARKMALSAATIAIPRDQGGDSPESLALARCTALYQEFLQKGTFVGYTAATRQSFLDRMAADIGQGAVPDVSTVDRSEFDAGVGNGCYYSYGGTAGAGGNEVLTLHIFIEGREIWPVFTRGLLGFFRGSPVTMYGRAAYTAEGVAPRKSQIDALEGRLNTSLTARGVTIQSLVGYHDNTVVGKQPAFEADNHTFAPLQEVGYVAGPHIDRTSGTVTGNFANSGISDIRSTDGRSKGIQYINVDNPSARGEGIDIPLVVNAIVYAWKARANRCGGQTLDPTLWTVNAGPGYKWMLNPSEFLDLQQGGNVESSQAVNYLPCWNGTCGSTNRTGRYTSSSQMKEMPRFYLPVGDGPRTNGFYFARTTNVDGNNSGAIVRNVFSGDSDSPTFKLKCSFGRDAIREYTGDGQIKTMIGAGSNAPDRGCPPLSNVSAPRDIGPYQELRTDFGCAAPASGGFGIIKNLHSTEYRYQNPVDRFLPYYKYTPTCGNGTPHCGYFGSSKIGALNRNDYLEYGDSNSIKDSVPRIVFDFKARIITNSNYTRVPNKVLLSCMYARNSRLQHCCLGISRQWCLNNVSIEDSSFTHNMTEVCDCTERHWNSDTLQFEDRDVVKSDTYLARVQVRGEPFFSSAYSHYAGGSYTESGDSNSPINHLAQSTCCISRTAQRLTFNCNDPRCTVRETIDEKYSQNRGAPNGEYKLYPQNSARCNFSPLSYGRGNPTFCQVN